MPQCNSKNIFIHDTSGVSKAEDVIRYAGGTIDNSGGIIDNYIITISKEKDIGDVYDAITYLLEEWYYELNLLRK
jgi:hypothetical protein